MIDRFYLIVGDVAWISRLVPLGVRLVQLRLKDQPAPEIRRQVRLARDICARHGCQLIVNDHWQIARDEGCDFIHLGQEDMQTADFPALRRAGMRFGLSTHDRAELDKALAQRPDYVALGPVYPTLLKKMAWAPQGLDRLGEWKSVIGDLPLVAIGGLTPARLPGVFAAGADSAAVVTDIMRAPDPAARVRDWIGACQ